MTLQLIEETCKNRKSHTPDPPGYIEWHAWAERMGKTHQQVRCPECGLWAIWIKKEKRARAVSSGIREGKT